LTYTRTNNLTYTRTNNLHTWTACLVCVSLKVTLWYFGCSVLQCVAMCCSVLQCVAVCCSVLQCVAVCYNVSQCVAVCCSVLQCKWLFDQGESLLLCKWYLTRRFFMYVVTHPRKWRAPFTRMTCLSTPSSPSFCMWFVTPPHTWMSHVTHMNESHRTYEIFHSFHTYGRIVSHLWIVQVLSLCTCERLVGSFKLQVSFAKEPYERDYILQKRPYVYMWSMGWLQLVGSLNIGLLCKRDL